MLTDLENLKNFKESEIEKLWCKFEEILRMYWEQTEDRRREYLMMKDCDRQNCHQIFNNNHQIKEVIVSEILYSWLITKIVYNF